MLIQMMFGIVGEAETLFGSGTGDLKYAWVIGKIQERAPPFIKIFLCLSWCFQIHQLFSVKLVILICLQLAYNNITYVGIILEVCFEG
jgi:hypothetical protein